MGDLFPPPLHPLTSAHLLSLFSPFNSPPFCDSLSLFTLIAVHCANRYARLSSATLSFPISHSFHFLRICLKNCITTMDHGSVYCLCAAASAGEKKKIHFNIE